MARRRLWAAFAVGTICLGILAARVEAGLLITQHSSGLPGKPDGAPTPGRMLVGTGKLRIDDRSEGGRQYIVRLDRAVVWEVDPKLEMFTETTFEFLRKRREQAEEKRDKARELHLKKHADKLIDDAKLAEFLRENAATRDGKLVVTVARAPAVLGGERVERIAVELNGVTQVAVWQTDKYKEYKPPQELVDFLDRSGVLPEDIATALKQALTLFPVRIEAHVDYFEAGGDLEFRIDGVVAWPEEADKFEVPASYRKVDEFPKGAILAKTYKCPICSKVVDPVTAVGPEKDKKTGEKLFFCSVDHEEEYIYKR